MLPSISNILNPPNSSSFNHQFDSTHQHVTPMHGQPRLPSPAEILNYPNAMVPTHFNRTVCPITCSTQPFEAARRMFPFPIDHRCQLVYAENRAYPGYINPCQTAFEGSFGGYSINTSATAPINTGMPSNPTSDATNLPGTRDRFAIPSSHPTPGYMAPIAAMIRAQPGIHLPLANPEQNVQEPPISLPQTQNTQNGVDYQTHSQETQLSEEQSRSIHHTSHPPSSANGPSSAASTHPESDSSSPDTSSTPQTQEQAGTPMMNPVPVFFGERLFPSREELDFRKLHFLHNVYPPAFPIITPKKRGRSYVSLTSQRNGQESVASDTDSNSDEELHCKRVKIIRTSQPATELLLDFANASPMVQDDSSPGYYHIPYSGSQRHSNPPTSGNRSPREREGQMTLQKSWVPSLPDNQEHSSPLRSESVPTNRRSDQRKRCALKTLSKSGFTFKNGESTEVSRNDAESNEIPPGQAPLEVNHEGKQLIMHASIAKNTLKCDECDAMFATEDSIVRHKRAQHTVATCVSQMVKCPECSLLLRNKQNLKRHLATHGPNANHKCKECTAKFVTERARTTHMRDVHGRKAEQRSVRDRSTRCPIKNCPYASNQKTNVKRHYENKHLNIKRFHCTLPVCEYVGSTRANRQAHMKTHEKETKKIQQDEVGQRKET